MVISHLASPFNLLCVERYQRVNYDHACPSVVDFAQFCFQLSWAPENCFIHLNVTQNEIMLKGLSWQLIFWHKVSWLQIWFYEIWKWFLDACYVYIFIFILIIAGFDYLHICFMIFKHCIMQHWHENYANVGKTKFLN